MSDPKRWWPESEEEMMDALESEAYAFGTALSSRVCRACWAGELHWERVADNWRLFKDRQMHVCPVKPLVISFANGSKITAGRSRANPVHGFAPPPTDEDIPL